MLRWKQVAGVAVILAGGSVAMAQDWPQWRGPARDGMAAGFVAPETWPKELTQKWRVNVGQGDSTPALVGDRLFVHARQGAEEVILCLSAADGKEIWRDKYAVPAISGPDARAHGGPRSTPAVADGKVVTLGVSGIVSCVDAASGKALWRNDEFKGVPRFHTSTSPLIVDGMAIVHLGGGNDAALVAFDLATGQQKWKWTGDAPAYASPVVMTADGVKQIVTLTEKLAVGVSAADGKLLWQIPFAAQGRAYNAATPIVDGQTVIFGGAGRGTRAVKVAKEGDAFAAKQLWSNPQVAPQFNTPVLSNGLLFGISERGNVFCIDAKTGQTAWTDTNRVGTYGGMIGAGPVIIALPDGAPLLVFKADAKAYAELARYKVSEGAVYASPIVSGKRIFVKDQDSLTLWSLE